MEIAEQCGNQEIIATLKRHTTSASAGNVCNNIIIMITYHRLRVIIISAL